MMASAKQLLVQEPFVKKPALPAVDVGSSLCNLPFELGILLWNRNLARYFFFFCYLGYTDVKRSGIIELKAELYP